MKLLILWMLFGSMLLSFASYGQDQSWTTVSVPGICTFQIPPIMEIRQGVAKKLLDNRLDHINAIEVTEERDRVIATRKGISEGLNQHDFASILLETFLHSPHSYALLNDPLALSKDELRVLCLEFQEQAQNKVQTMSETLPNANNIQMIEWIPLSITRIGGVDALTYGYRRQIDNNPPAKVTSYVVQNFDRMHTLTITIREGGEETTRTQLLKVPDTFKFVRGDTAQESRIAHEPTIEYLLANAQRGDPESQASVGLLYYHMGDFSQAVSWLTKAVEQNHAEAQACLAELYYEGKHVPKDYARAASLYLKAAKQGVPEAQHGIAFLYFTGRGVRQNAIEGYAWYIINAKHGDDEVLIQMKKEPAIRRLRPQALRRAAELEKTIVVPEPKISPPQTFSVFQRSGYLIRYSDKWSFTADKETITQTLRDITNALNIPLNRDGIPDVVFYMGKILSDSPSTLSIPQISILRQEAASPWRFKITDELKQKFRDDMISRFTHSVPSFRFYSFSIEDAGSHVVIKFVWSATLELNNVVQNSKTKALLYMSKTSNVYFAISYQAEPSLFEKHLESAREVISSFTLL